MQALIARIVKTHGRLDCAYNNAGIEGDVIDTHEASERNFDRVMAINVKGVWLCMKYEIRQMRKQGGRRDRQYRLGRRSHWAFAACRSTLRASTRSWD